MISKHGMLHVVPRIYQLSLYQGFNRVIPNSDQNQISPCNINAQLSAQVSRIMEMITRDELC